MKWAEILIEARPDSAEAVTDILLAEGCQGTAHAGGDGESAHDQTDVRGWLPVDDRLEPRLASIGSRVRGLAALGLDLRSDEIGVKLESGDDWATAWRAFFKPIRVGRIVVKPSWEACETSAHEVVVEIDPGMAFGTGYHPTTQLCLMAVQELVTGGETVLDVGTGSGILAIAAAKLGASRVVGLDIDPVAVEAARANVALAGLGRLVDIEEADGPHVFDGEADIVVANIVPKAILDLAAGLQAKLGPGGRLVVSGIVEERAGEVRAKLEGFGLSTLALRRDGDWVALISERSG